MKATKEDFKALRDLCWSSVESVNGAEGELAQKHRERYTRLVAACDEMLEGFEPVKLKEPTGKNSTTKKAEEPKTPSKKPVKTEEPKADDKEPFEFE